MGEQGVWGTPWGGFTNLYIYILDTVPPIHVAWNHVETDWNHVETDKLIPLQMAERLLRAQPVYSQ